MYILQSGIKQDPHRRWSLPDRIFFGYGACHILSGVYLDRPPLADFYAERIIPGGTYPGNHVYVTDGVIAFDFHGYSMRSRLLAHHSRGWSRRYGGWHCSVVPVEFCLLSTKELNARKMLGPDQYLYPAIPRARTFIAQMDHACAAASAQVQAGQPGE